jgi:hypothetical protein
MDDTDWVREGREHADAGRLFSARRCFQKALRLNLANSVARKRLEDLPALLRARAAYKSGCLVCGISITSAVDRRCPRCHYYVCPNGHCRCTRSKVAANRRGAATTDGQSVDKLHRPPPPTPESGGPRGITQYSRRVQDMQISHGLGRIGGKAASDWAADGAWLAKQWRLREARDCYGKALACNPNYFVARRQYERLSRQFGTVGRGEG